MSESPSHSFPNIIKGLKKHAHDEQSSGVAVCGVQTDFSLKRSDPILPSTLLLLLSKVPHQRGTKHQLT